jgi:hypothetical protein
MSDVPIVNVQKDTWNGRDWYWRVGEEKGRVYASARATYVPVTDAAYQAWVTAYSLDRTTPIEDEEKLKNVLAPWGVRFGP